MIKEEEAQLNVVFDNTGTLSNSIKYNTYLTREDHLKKSVPFVPEDQARLAQININITESNAKAFDTNDLLGRVIDEHDISLYLSLTNTQTSVPEVTEKLNDVTNVSGKDILSHFEAIVDDIKNNPPPWLESNHRFEMSVDIPRGVQVTIDLENSELTRIFGYTAIVKLESYDVVDRLNELGHALHVASGDADSILFHTGRTLGLSDQNVYPFQTMEDKALTIRNIRNDSKNPVIMVGDFVNDYLAFKEADVSVLVLNENKGEETYRLLSPVADHEILEISELPEIIETGINELY